MCAAFSSITPYSYDAPVRSEIRVRPRGTRNDDEILEEFAILSSPYSPSGQSTH